MTAVDRDLIRTWLDVYRPAPGHIVVSAKNQGFNGPVFNTHDLDNAADHIARLAAATDVWIRVTTLREPPKTGRGAAADSLALIGFWADIDTQGPGHKGDNYPPTIIDGLTILEGLPDTTVIFHSGGGLQAWWLFDTPWVLTTDDIDTAADAAERWTRLLQTNARDRGWNVDSTGDLARILRPPGTLNHKPEYLEAYDQPLPVRVHERSGRRYNRETLLTLIDDDQADDLTRMAAGATRPTSGDASDVIDAWSARTDWADLLTPHGWTLGRTTRDGVRFWTRPGKSAKDGWSAITNGRNKHVLIQFSSNAGLPVSNRRTKLTKFRVFAELEHNGDTKTAYAAIAPPRTHSTAQEQADDSADPGFFTSRGGLRVITLTEAVTNKGPIASSHAGELYRYTNGVWRSDGERIVRNRIVELLGERYRMAHAAVVADVLRNREPIIGTTRQDTRYLNLPNGLLDWRAGKLRDYTPDIASIIRIPIEWDPDATCPAIDQWLGEVFPDDSREFIEEVIGYALYNDNPLHKAILLFGRGRNGKGTFLRLLRALIGEDNVSAVTPQSLDENRFRAAELHGKLANLVGDVDPRIFQITETFKQITGGDLVTAERKYGQPFRFHCRALMIAAFNALPRSSDTSEGFFSRWIVVPFTKYFPEGVANPHLLDKLTSESELRGLLVLAVNGLRRLMGRGRFNIPESVEKETAVFRQVADPVRAFLTEYVEDAGEMWQPRTQVYRDYKSWCDETGHKPLAAGGFYERVEVAGQDVTTHQITARKRQGTRGYRIEEKESAQAAPSAPSAGSEGAGSLPPAAPSAPKAAPSSDTGMDDRQEQNNTKDYVEELSATERGARGQPLPTLSRAPTHTRAHTHARDQRVKAPAPSAPSHQGAEGAATPHNLSDHAVMPVIQHDPSGRPCEICQQPCYANTNGRHAHLACITKETA